MDQTESARAIQPISITSHRRRRTHEMLTRLEHHQVSTKRTELGWLAQQTAISLMAPLSLVGASEQATGKNADRVELMARTFAEDNLYFRG